MSVYKNIIAHFRYKKILVIGDVILDQHIRGSVHRISPEAPVPIVLQEGDPTFSPGGAANVAYNLRSLGSQVTLVGRIGRDIEGKQFLREIEKRKITTRGILVDPKIPTIVKTRIVAHHQQVVRLDREKAEQPCDGKLAQRILNFLQKNIHRFDAIIISDYGKGMVSAELVREVCSLALQNKKVVTVDPKVEHFMYYQGATSITPNRKEAENAIRNIKITQSDRRRLAIHTDRLSTHGEIEKAGTELVKYLRIESLLITLGEEGMYLFERGKKPAHIPTVAREVFDVTGAGDTVIAVFTLSLTAGATKFQAADLANHAAGIVVGKMGTVAVTTRELLAATKIKNKAI